MPSQLERIASHWTLGLSVFNPGDNSPNSSAYLSLTRELRASHEVGFLAGSIFHVAGRGSV
jgi:hypothetical protein